MSVVPNLENLKRRLDRFFWQNRSTETALLREVLTKDFFKLGGVAVIGGLVRDFARGGRSAFKSDVDLVIDGNADEVSRFAARVQAQPNRFGGYGYAVGPWKIDFWALEKTWAFTEGHVAVKNLADVVQCTFFDWDAAIYDLRNKRIACADGYLDRIRSRQIEIALRSNPEELGNLLRATRRILGWDLRPGPKLNRFIWDHLDDDAFEAMRISERKKHNVCLLEDFQDAAHLRLRLLGNNWNNSCDYMQLELPFGPIGAVNPLCLGQETVRTGRSGSTKTAKQCDGQDGRLLAKKKRAEIASRAAANMLQF